MSPRKTSSSSTSRLSSNIALVAVIAASIASTAEAVGADFSLPILRSSQSALPESIRREVFAAIDRTCDSFVELRGTNGVWRLADDSATILPATVICESFATETSALDEAIRQVESRARFPWSSRDAEEALFVSVGALLEGLEPPKQAIQRLKRVDLSLIGAGEAALLVTTLSMAGVAEPADWERLLRRSTQEQSSICAVAAGAIARMNRVRAVAPESMLSKDALAHIRWLSSRVGLGYVRQGREARIAPNNALVLSILAAMIPRKSFVEETGLFPYDWRQHLASRLLAWQNFGADYCGWSTFESEMAPKLTYEDVKSTILAVLALKILAL